jgi:hypothetical protein
MKIANPTKATIALVALICLTVLRYGDKIDQATFAGFAGLIIGYAVGNGLAAKQNVPVEPIIGKRDQ